MKLLQRIFWWLHFNALKFFFLFSFYNLKLISPTAIVGCVTVISTKFCLQKRRPDEKIDLDSIEDEGYYWIEILFANECKENKFGLGLNSNTFTFHFRLKKKQKTNLLNISVWVFNYQTFEDLMSCRKVKNIWNQWVPLPNMKKKILSQSSAPFE